MKKQKSDLESFFTKRVGGKLEKLRHYFSANNLVIFFLAKKQAGKGTYAKILGDLTGGKTVHLSIGDLVREADKEARNPEGKRKLIADLKKYYQGKGKIEEIVEVFINQAESAGLLPTEAVMALIERAIKRDQDKSIIIDGFPRSKEQVALAMQMQQDFEKKGLPSVFIEINCPEEVLIRRYVDRRVCPVCQTPRNIKLLLTKEVEYDEKNGEFHLVCDRPECKRARMVMKQGDKDGIDRVRERQREVQEMIDHIKVKAPHLHIAVHNTVPLEEAHKHEMTDFTEEAELIWDPEKKEVVRKFKPMIATDDEGRKAYSRWPEPVVVDMIDRLAGWLDGLGKKRGL